MLQGTVQKRKGFKKKKKKGRVLQKEGGVSGEVISQERTFSVQVIFFSGERAQKGSFMQIT